MYIYLKKKYLKINFKINKKYIKFIIYYYFSKHILII